MSGLLTTICCMSGWSWGGSRGQRAKNAVNVRLGEDPDMHTFLIAVGCAWFAAAMLFVVALCVAARRPVPSSFPDDIATRRPEQNRRRNSSLQEAPVSSLELLDQAEATFTDPNDKDNSREVREPQTVASQAQ